MEIKDRRHHVIVTRRDPRTGERIDDFAERQTMTPCTHREACTIVSKAPIRKPTRTADGRLYRASYELEEARTA